MYRMRLGLALLHGAMIVLGQRRCRDKSGEQEAAGVLHAASPSSGRTVTTRNMPACMWSSR